MNPIDEIVKVHAGNPKAQRAALAELRSEQARAHEEARMKMVQTKQNVVALGGMLEYLDAWIAAEKPEA